MYFSDAPYYGGAEKYLELLISGLDRRRYEPVLVTRKGAELGAFVSRMRNAGTPAEETSLRGPYDLGGYADFYRLVRRTGPRLLHVNLAGTYDAQAGLVAPVARLAGCGRVVTTEHLAMVGRLWKRHAAKRFSSIFVTRVISITESNVPFLTGTHRVPARKIAVIHNGVDLDALDSAGPAGLRSELGLDDSVFVFAAVGGLVERKGHRFLLRAFARLRERTGVKCALVIVGSGEEEAALRGLAGELSLRQSAFFVGHREDAAALMREVDCLVVPSLIEGMPFVIMEAMASSKPVIASRIYGIPEIVLEGETGLLVEPGDAEALFGAMRTLCQDRDMASCMGRRGRLRVSEEFSLKRMARETQDLYELVLGAGAVQSDRARSGGESWPDF
jgi:glycosyltransferase involved in cell wall biosynthesis